MHGAAPMRHSLFESPLLHWLAGGSELRLPHTAPLLGWQGVLRDTHTSAPPHL